MRHHTWQKRNTLKLHLPHFSYGILIEKWSVSMIVIIISINAAKCILKLVYSIRNWQRKYAVFCTDWKNVAVIYIYLISTWESYI
jgi:hypothetical protein